VESLEREGVNTSTTDLVDPKDQFQTNWDTVHISGFNDDNVYLI
jgi:hypothetical protein